jgi:hypothetical protein
VFVGSLLFIACSGDGETDRPDDETGGTSGASGTGATGGTGTPTGGAAGSGATGGSGGSGTAGGGSGGMAGMDPCAPCTPTTDCPSVMLPSDGIINNFDNLYVGETEPPENGIYGANDASGALKEMWWTGYFSGAYAYPDAGDTCAPSTTPLTRSLAGGQLHVTGTVGTYSGFGTWMEQCHIDMSAFSGISFRIGGDAGPTGTVQLRVFEQANTAPIDCRPMRGTCADATCSPATFAVTVPATPAVVTVAWDDFTGGAPSATVNPAQIWQFQWDFDWAEGGTPFPVDVTLDDVTLTP